MDPTISHPVYRPLPGPNYIRVLTVHPAKDREAPIDCTLHTTSLDDPCLYQALSYSWSEREDGRIEFIKSILCNGHRVSVTSSAFGAMRRFRQRDEGRALWIDAVCIDQGNNAERTQQVSIMAKVYSAATSLLIWLGEESSHQVGPVVNTIFEGLADQKYGSFIARPGVATDAQFLLKASWLVGRWQQDGGYATYPVYFDTRPYPPEYMNRAEDPERESLIDERNSKALIELERCYTSELQDIRVPLLESVLSFLSYRWFGRRWILQEIFHGRDATVYVGLHEIPLERIALAVHELYELRYRFRDEPKLDVIHRASKMGLIAFGGQPNSIQLQFKFPYGRQTDSRFSAPIDVIWHFQGFNCLDDRDKIFALSSMHDVLLVMPDYSLTVPEVYCRFAEASAATSGVQLLWAAALQQPKRLSCSGGEVLPSWVPDWRVHVEKPEVFDDMFWHSLVNVAFSGQHAIKNEDRSLSLQAWVLGPITWQSNLAVLELLGGRLNLWTGRPESLPREKYGDIRSGDMVLHLEESWSDPKIVVRHHAHAHNAYSIVGWVDSSPYELEVAVKSGKVEKQWLMLL